MNNIAVLLVDDHNMVRQCLRFLLEAQPDIAIVGEAETGRQAVQLARELQPDVILMDILMPDLNGLEATRQIMREMPQAKVLMLSSYTEDQCLDQVMEVGASGYLQKHGSTADLLNAVRETSKGNSFFSPAVTRRLCLRSIDSLLDGTYPKKRVSLLTAREGEVLQLIAEGRANKQIAADLGISIKTVEKHRQQVMNKLNIHDTAGLTRYAMNNGVIETSVRLQV